MKLLLQNSAANAAWVPQAKLLYGEKHSDRESQASPGKANATRFKQDSVGQRPSVSSSSNAAPPQVAMLPVLTENFLGSGSSVQNNVETKTTSTTTTTSTKRRITKYYNNEHDKVKSCSQFMDNEQQSDELKDYDDGKEQE